MTKPHDDELRNELLDVPDHGAEFWPGLEADLATSERENVVPLASASAMRPRSRGLLLAAAVVAVLGGVGAWFAFGGEDQGPDVAVDPEPSVTTAPEDVPAAVQFEFRWIEPDGDPNPVWSTWTRDERGGELIVHPSGALRYEVPGEGVGYSPPGVEIDPLSGPRDDYDRIDDDARWVGHLWLDGAETVTETAETGRGLLAAEVESYREGDLRVELLVDAVTWMPVEAIYSDGVRFETRGFDDTVSPEAIVLPDPSTHSPDDPWLTWPEPPPESEGGPEPSFRLTWTPPGFTESENGRALEAPWRTVTIDDGRGREDDMLAVDTHEPAGVLVGGMFDGETVLRSMPITFGPRASVLTVDGRVTVSGDVPFGDMVRILEGMEDADPTEVVPIPDDAVQSMTATVERVSEVGVSGEFTLVADQDGTIVLKSADVDFGYHAPSGASWGRESEQTAPPGRSEAIVGVWNEIDPIHGRSRLESLLFLDLAEAVRYGEFGTVADRDGRSAIEATVELADNESAGWFDRTATLVIDFQTGFVLDASIIDGTGEIVEELHLTDVEWSEDRADVSGAVGVDSDWVVTEGLPDEPVVGDRYLVPDGVEPVRTFTTEAPVQSGSEAGNPEADGAYVIDVTTAPWRHSKIVVLGRTEGAWQDPLAEEGWFTQPTQVKTTGVLAGPGLVVTATPPVRPRAWSDALASEIVAIEGLVDPATARRLVNLTVAGSDPGGAPREVPAVTTAPAGAESAFSIADVDGGGSVVARRVEGGPAAESPWVRAVAEIWWEPERGGIRPWPPERLLDTGDAHAVVLLDAFVDDDGEVAVIYGEIPSPDETQPAEADLWLQRFGQPRSEAISLGWFTGAEYGVDAASRGRDRIAISAGADLGEIFSFYDLDGNEIDEPNNPVPVGHRYSEPPFYQHVSLGPDGRTLAFVEGPDFDREANGTVGDWELVVVDLDSVEETARILLFDRSTIEVTHLDFDGTWAVISRDDPIVDRAEPVTALAVNVYDGTVTELPDTSGIVTLPR